MEAAAYAERTGRTFSRHWTVHYERAGIAEHKGAAFVGKLLDTARRDVRRAGGELAALWARENGDGKGGHVHIALHLPAGMSLRGRTRRWLETAGGTWRKGVSRSEPIGGTLASARAAGERHSENVWIVVGYLLKGADAATGEALGLDRYGEGGRVVGKRCGCTQNLNRAARKLAGE